MNTQSEQFTLLVTNLGVLQIYSLSFNDFCLHFGANMASYGYYSFLNKWSWGFSVVPLLYQAYVRIQSEQFTLLATNLGSPQRDNLTCSDFGCSFAQNRQGTDAPIF